MVGVSKRPIRRLFSYKEEDLKNAIDSIKNQLMGYREACRYYGVPFATVHDRLSGKVAVNKKPKVGPDPVLGVQGEEKLTKWIIDMAKCGFPLNKQDLLESVSKIIAKSGAKTPFKDGKPGDTWYQKFLKRHPQISIREPEGINNARAVLTEKRIRCWFKDLREFIESIDAMDIFQDPDRIFNGDETGFSLSPKSGKVLGPKGYKNLYVIKKNNEKENITVLLVFSASGQLCPPLVIFPYVRPPKALVDNMPESWVLGRSESGWMKSDVFYEYITNDFNAWLTKNKVKRPIILFIDGHKSHMTFPLSEFCQANGIILYALPPNSTHMLQPADVSVFRPLKQNWKTTVKEWQSDNINQVVTKLNFCSVLNKTLTETHLADIISNGFRRCGLYPLNEDAVDYTKCVKDTQQNVGRERVQHQNASEKTATAKEFDAAIKVISILKSELAERSIESGHILEEIEKAKTKCLQKRRSKSKTPRNSAASNQSTSIINITNEILADITPDNLNFDNPNTVLDVAQPRQNILIDASELLTDSLCVTDETITENISLHQPGSFISLKNISVMPLEEIQISHISQPTLAQQQQSPMESADDQCYTVTVLADVHSQNDNHATVLINQQNEPDEILSFDDIFEKHLRFPEPPEWKDKKRNASKLPSAISSQAWREHYKKKDEEKENLVLEKKRRQQLRAEEKEKKTVEKRKKKKKTVLKKGTKKAAVQCSECLEALISDVEDDAEKNIGCDNCIRWFHLKCTEMCNKSYVEAAISTYTCPFCNKCETETNH
ncbi:uncharacterized protein LOC126976946 [Leptidea sinapis]|uniref:uncharacterized protein LOC126976946 n=1 Tax=Leptidea sinapis TaxID=189913 RepID=UPI00212EA6BD|nr:uncharacterized protein LOC126976946 [Leptidea sinapis]